MNSGIRFGLWIFIVFIVGPTLLAQNTLTIEISGLQNARGNIVLELCDSDKNIVKGIVEGLQSNHCTLIISNLPTDTYSFRYFHDENKNSE